MILGGSDNSRVQNQDVRESKDSVRPGPTQPPLCAALPGPPPRGEESRKESREGESGERHQSAGWGKGLRVSPNSVSLEVKKQKRKSYLSRAPL